MTTKKILCVTHAPCLDGTASAWVVGLRYGRENVEFVSATYGDAIPDLTGRDVVIVDFSYPPELLLAVADKANSIVMIDHHLSAIERWKGVAMPTHMTTVFGLLKSGVGLVWQYYFPKQPLPTLLQRIEDRDLWRFAYPDTVDVCAYCMGMGWVQPEESSFVEFDRVIPVTRWARIKHHVLRLVKADPVSRMANHGQMLAQTNLVLATQLAQNATLMEVGGVWVPVANVPYALASLVGHLLSQNQPFSVTYFDDLTKGVRCYSLRSQSDPQGADVKSIAQEYGGGGHYHASGFKLPIDQAAIQQSLIVRLERALPVTSLPGFTR